MQYKKIVFKALQLVLTTGALISQPLTMEKEKEILPQPQTQEISPFSTLPKPIIYKIFESLSPLDFRTLPQVCQKFKNYIYKGIDECLSDFFDMESTKTFDSKECYPYAKSHYRQEAEGFSYLKKRLQGAQKLMQKIEPDLLPFYEKVTVLFKQKVFLSYMLDHIRTASNIKDEKNQGPLITSLYMSKLISESERALYPNVVSLFSINGKDDIFEYIKTWEKLSFLDMFCEQELDGKSFYHFINSIKKNENLVHLSLSGREEEAYFGDFVSKIINHEEKMSLKKIILASRSFTKKMTECLKKDLKNNKNITSLVMIEDLASLMCNNKIDYTQHIQFIQNHIKERFSILETLIRD